MGLFLLELLLALLGVGHAQTVAQKAPASGIVAQLELYIDASQGSVTTGSSIATDFSGKNRHGTFRAPGGAVAAIGTMDANILYDTTDISPCIFFKGFKTSGQGWLEWNPTHPLQGYSSYTTEAWIKIPVATQGSDYNMLFYSSVGPNCAYQNYGVAMMAECCSGVIGNEINNDWSGTSSGYVIPQGVWLHYVTTYDGPTGVVKSYLNGQMVWTRTTGANYAIPSGTWNYVGIGGYDREQYSGSCGYTNARISYLALYGHAFSQASVTKAYYANYYRFFGSCPMGYSSNGPSCVGAGLASGLTANLQVYIDAALGSVSTG